MLAGDHLQLPPVVTSEEAAARWVAEWEEEGRVSEGSNLLLLLQGSGRVSAGAGGGQLPGGGDPADHAVQVQYTVQCSTVPC